LKTAAASPKSEIIMPNLKGMTVEALMSLRNQIDKRLLELRAELEKQLAALSGQSKRKIIGLERKEGSAKIQKSIWGHLGRKRSKA
jgi:flagellar biosynthesis/type III secretory pathway protein FliH